MKIKIIKYITIVLYILFTTQFALFCWNTLVNAMTGELTKLIVNRSTVSSLSWSAPRLWNYSVEKQIEKVFGEDAPVAKAIAKAESGMRCDAVSHTSDIGPFQINVKVHAKRAYAMNLNLMDCTQNIQFAKVLYDEQNWTPWVTYNTKAYLAYLK